MRLSEPAGTVKRMAAVLFASLPLLVFVGCGGSSSPEGEPTSEVQPGGSDVADGQGAFGTGGSGSGLVLGEMPTGDVVTPTDIKELGEGDMSVVLAGRIDAGSMEPFQPGEVAFMISQLPDEGHAADDPDHADNCPFCKRKLENAPKAIVQFRDANGNVMAGDARQILSVDKGDVVYVTGTASYNSAVNTVMVNATGVYRQPSS